MEDKLLDLTNKYWYKARSRGRKVKLLYDPNPVLIDKIFLTTNNFEAVKPFNRAAILHNKFNFKIYNRTHVPRDYVIF